MRLPVQFLDTSVDAFTLLKNLYTSVDAFTLLKNRSCLRVSGIDAVKFLQGLTTNQMNKIERGGEGMLSLFLQSNVSFNRN